MLKLDLSKELKEAEPKKKEELPEIVKIAKKAGLQKDTLIRTRFLLTK